MNETKLPEDDKSYSKTEFVLGTETDMNISKPSTSSNNYKSYRPSGPLVSSNRSKQKGLFLAVIILVLAAGGFLIYRNHNSHKSTTVLSQSSSKPAKSGEVKKNTIRFVATGDMIAHSAILARADKGNGSYDFSSPDPMLTNMEPFYKKADISFCNEATPAGGTKFGITGYPVFNAPLEWPKYLNKVGCNLINTGTNHTNDKGQALIDATAAAWDDLPNVLAVAGANRNQAEQDKVHLFTVKGVKFAYLSYTTYTNNKDVSSYGINMYNDALVTRQLQEARSNADFVIVSMRWGTEYSPDVNAEQSKDAQKLADLGADIILGHGTHVIQPVAKLKGKDGRETLVWYGLGNMLNAQLDIESLIGGFAVMDIDATTKKITNISFMPTYMHYEWTAAQKKAEDLLSRKNFEMFALDKSASPLTKSQNNTTVEAQTTRITAVLNKLTTVPVISSSQY